MKKTSLACLLIAIGLLLVFGVLTVLLVCVDVRPAGLSAAEIGLATFNEAVFEALGQSEVALTVSEVCGVLILCGVAAFGVLGLVQIIRRKGILRADRELYLMACGFVLLAVIYVFFEIVVINHRPVLEDGVLAASYPSSHTMLAVAFAGTCTAYVIRRVRNSALRITFITAANVAAAVTVAGRLLGGVHWLTDVVAGVLIGLAVTFGYLAACGVACGKERRASADPETSM